MKKIILASESYRRKLILEQLKLDFEIIPSNFREDMTLKLPPLELAKHLALGKGRSVAKKHPTSVVISGDTFIVLDNEIIGKPHSHKNATKMLKKLSGKTHTVITGVSVIEGKKEIVDAVVSKVTFKKLTDEEIENYIEEDDPLKYAGAYKIQELGAALVEKIEGDYFNVVGLPINKLLTILKKFGIRVI